MDGEARRGLREPFSSISHFVGAVLFAAGLVVLLALAWGHPAHVASFIVYSACAIGLYLASGIYHSSHKSAELLQRLDHMAIYFMIAGTYTPICVVALPKPLGWWLLLAQWGMAAIGVFANLVLKGGPHWLRIVLYLGMGWMAAGIIPALNAALNPSATAWLIAGGVVYTLGVPVYATERPRLWPGKFGAHDLWHIFVLVASLCHYVVMLSVARI